MKPLFNKRSSLQVRLLSTLIAASALMLMDSRWAQFSGIRRYLDMALMPLYYVANRPWRLVVDCSAYFMTHSQLQSDNQALRQVLLLQQSDLLFLEQLQQENNRLRQLLDTPIRQPQRKMVARLLAAEFNPYSQQILLDKGSLQGVYKGQPVINDKGVVGQVVAVNYCNSRVLLISDPSHAIPVRIARTGHFTIAQGTGELSVLQLGLLPLSTDIQPGDRLVTSGLDGRFPEGYPVAEISTVTIDQPRSQILVKTRTTAALGQLHSVLLLWPESLPQASTVPAESSD
jgi:rod shape-determining protein MreC